MRKIIQLAIILTTLTSCIQQVKVNSKEEASNKVCDKIMSNLQKGKVSEALLLLKKNSVVITSQEIDTLQKQIIEVNNSIILPSYGRPLSYEFVLEKSIKDIARKRYYVIKYERYFIKVSFILYNNGRDWVINGFTFDDTTALL